MSRSENATREWYETSFAELVSNADVRRAARLEMVRLADGSDVIPLQSDLEAARNYLKKCVMNMSPVELQVLSAEEAGALWARGALGAARFRKDGGPHRVRSRRLRRRKRESRGHR